MIHIILLNVDGLRAYPRFHRMCSFAFAPPPSLINGTTDGGGCYTGPLANHSPLALPLRLTQKRLIRTASTPYNSGHGIILSGWLGIPGTWSRAQCQRTRRRLLRGSKMITSTSRANSSSCSQHREASHRSHTSSPCDWEQVSSHSQFWFCPCATVASFVIWIAWTKPQYTTTLEIAPA